MASDLGATPVVAEFSRRTTNTRQIFVCRLAYVGEGSNSQLIILSTVRSIYPMVHQLPAAPDLTSVHFWPLALRHLDNRVLRLGRRRLWPLRCSHSEHLQVGLLRPWRQRPLLHLVCLPVWTTDGLHKY